MFETIVVGIDGSEVAEGAASVAADLARRDHARLLLTHADEGIIARGGGGDRHEEDEIKAGIHRRLEELREAGIHAEERIARVAVGAPAAYVADIAEEVHADVIVVGVHGTTGSPGLVVGSVTQRLLELSTCPVLVIPRQKRDADAPP